LLKVIVNYITTTKGNTGKHLKNLLMKDMILARFRDVAVLTTPKDCANVIGSKLRFTEKSSETLRGLIVNLMNVESRGIFA